MSIDSEVQYFFSQMKAFKDEEVSRAFAAQVFSPNNSGWDGAVILTNYRLCLVSEPGFFSDGLAAYVGWSALDKITYKNAQTLEITVEGSTYSAVCNEPVKPLINAFVSDTVRYIASEDYERGLALYNDRRVQESLPYLLAAQRKDPLSAWIRLSIADAYWDIGDYASGLQEVRAALAKDLFESTRERAHLMAGLFLQVQEDLEGALGELQKATKLGELPESHHTLGLIYERMGRPEEALNALRKAVEMDMGNPYYRADFINTLLREGTLAEVKCQIAEYEGLSEADKHFSEYIRGMVAAREGDYERAVLSLSPLLNDEKYALEVSQQLIALAEELKDFQLLRLAAQTAIYHDPDNILNYLKHVLACISLLQWTEANISLSVMQRLNGSMLSLHQRVACALMQAVAHVFQEENGSAVQAIDKAKNLIAELKSQDLFYVARQEEFLIDYLDARVAIANHSLDAAYQLLIHACRFSNAPPSPFNAFIVKHTRELLEEHGRKARAGIQPEMAVTSKRDETHSLLAALQRLLESNLRFVPAAKKLAVVRQQHKQPLLLAVMGEFNAGKSTFINALLGLDILPMDVVPTTATINVLCYGSTPGATIVWQDGATQELPLEHLRNYVTEQEQKQKNDLVRQIHHVEIRQPIDVLKVINLVDTPGLNATIEEHVQLTREYVAQADGIVWLFRADQPGKKTERDFLEFARNYSAKTIAVLNRIDRVPKDEIEDIVELLDEQMPGYFSAVIPMSAKQALEARQRSDEGLFQKSGLATLISTLKAQVLSGAQALKRDSLYQKLNVLIGEVDTVVLEIQREQSDSRVHINQAQSILSTWLKSAQCDVSEQIEDAVASGRAGLEAILREIAVVKSGPLSLDPSIPAFSRKILQHFQEQEFTRFQSIVQRFRSILDVTDGYKSLFNTLMIDSGETIGEQGLRLKLSISFDLLQADVDKCMYYLEGRLSVPDLLGVKGSSQTTPQQVSLIESFMSPLRGHMTERYQLTLERVYELACDWLSQVEEDVNAREASMQYELFLPLRDLTEALREQETHLPPLMSVNV